MAQDREAPSRSAFSRWRTQPTRWNDNDHYGHVNNVVYYEWFDSTVNGVLMAEAGCDVRELPAIGVVVETRCRYLQPVSFPEVLEIGLRCARLGTSSVTYELGVFRPGEDVPVAHGSFVHVYVDRDAGTPVAMPDEVRAALVRLADGTA